MNTLFGLAVITVLITLGVVAYMMPTLIALLRHAPDLAAVAVINILLGWTAAGWILALVLAARREAPSIHVIGQVNACIPGPKEPDWRKPRTGRSPADGVRRLPG